MHTQLSAVFNALYASIRAYNLAFGYHQPKINTSFLWGLYYIDYGQIQQADAAGNTMGSFRPTDWVMQVAASRSYLEKWKYGATVKFISSNYGPYRSNGIAMDVGVVFYDSAKLFSVSLLAKNMGRQLKKYDGTDPDDLPFDLQAGATKRLENSPLGFLLRRIIFINLISGITTGISMQITGLTMTAPANSHWINCSVILYSQPRFILATG